MNNCLFYIFCFLCSHQKPIDLPPSWVTDEFSCTQKPFIVDIGCSKGNWTTEYAASNPDKNVVGIDIRQAVIDLALARRSASQLDNVHFLKSNANVDISHILSSIEEVSSPGVEMITIQFPDPYFKARQHKRRLLNDEFLHNIVHGRVKAGTKIFVQTDVEELMWAMVEVLEKNKHLVALADGHSFTDTLLNPPPYDLPTEREVSCRENGNFEIFRIMVQTISSPSG